MNRQTDNTEIILDEFDSLPSLDDLMLELEEADDASFDDEAATVGGIRVVSEKAIEPVQESEPRAFSAAKNDSALRIENEELLLALRRVQSDFENYRRRVERERGDHYVFALNSVVKELLPVLDNFRLALTNAENHSSETDLKQFFSGFELILRQLEKVLSTLGIEPVKAVGEKFDPRFHEAVALEIVADKPSNTVVEELVRGYRLGEKLIRPAMVKVSR